MLKILLITFLLIGFSFANENKSDIKQEKIRLLKKINETFATGDAKKIFKLYKELASVYTKGGEYYKAIGYYKLALKLYLTTKDQDAKTKVALYKNLAFCYKKIGNNFKSFKYTYKAVKLANKTYGKNANITKKLDHEIAEIQSRMIAASI